MVTSPPDRKRNLALLALIASMGLLGRLSYEMLRTPVTPIYAQHLGVAPQLIGLIVAAATITGVFLKMPAGMLGDIVGLRRLMTAGTVPKAFGPFLYVAAVSPLGLFLVRLFHGLSTALYAPPAAALVAKLFPGERGRFLGIYSAAENAGVVLGPVIGGAVLLSFSFVPTFLVSGAIGLVSLALSVMVLTRHVPEDQPRLEKIALPNVMRALREIAGNRVVLLTALAEGSLFFGFGSLQGFLPLYAVRHGLNVAAIGVVFGAQGVASLLSRPYLGRLSDRVGRRPVIMGGLTAAAFVLLAVPWQSNVVALVLLGGLFGLATGAVTPAGQALIADVAQDGRVGTAMGMFGSLWDVGHALGPIVTGLLLGFLSYKAVFSTVGFIIVFALIVFGFFVREPARERVAAH